MNGDVWCDYPCQPYNLAEHDLAHLVLVNNPTHNLQGDFSLNNGRVASTGEPRYTFSGMGYYRPALFAELPAGKHPLAPLLRAAMQAGQVSGEHFNGDWRDIGTPERLAELDQDLTAS